MCFLHTSINSSRVFVIMLSEPASCLETHSLLKFCNTGVLKSFVFNTFAKSMESCLMYSSDRIGKCFGAMLLIPRRSREDFGAELIVRRETCHLYRDLFSSSVRTVLPVHAVGFIVQLKLEE